MERKARLEYELASEKKKLEQLRKEVQAMEKDLEVKRKIRIETQRLTPDALTVTVRNDPIIYLSNSFLSIFDLQGQKIGLAISWIRT